MLFVVRSRRRSRLRDEDTGSDYEIPGILLYTHKWGDTKDSHVIHRIQHYRNRIQREKELPNWYLAKDSNQATLSSGLGSTGSYRKHVVSRRVSRFGDLCDLIRRKARASRGPHDTVHEN